VVETHSLQKFDILWKSSGFLCLKFVVSPHIDSSGLLFCIMPGLVFPVGVGNFARYRIRVVITWPDLGSSAVQTALYLLYNFSKIFSCLNLCRDVSAEQTNRPVVNSQLPSPPGSKLAITVLVTPRPPVLCIKDSEEIAGWVWVIRLEPSSASGTCAPLIFMIRFS